MRYLIRGYLSSLLVFLLSYCVVARFPHNQLRYRGYIYRINLAYFITDLLVVIRIPTYVIYSDALERKIKRETRRRKAETEKKNEKE